MATEELTLNGPIMLENNLLDDKLLSQTAFLSGKFLKFNHY